MPERTREKATAPDRRSVNSGYEIVCVADVLHFMHNVEPLRGCDFSLDDAFHSGRMEIMAWLERRLRATGEAEVVNELARAV
jgi:hypothetical protein